MFQSPALPRMARKLERQTSVRELRSTRLVRLVVPRETGTFQDSAVNLFNLSPDSIRNCENYKEFITLTKNFCVKG